MTSSSAPPPQEKRKGHITPTRGVPVCKACGRSRRVSSYRLLLFLCVSLFKSSQFPLPPNIHYAAVFSPPLQPRLRYRQRARLRVFYEQARQPRCLTFGASHAVTEARIGRRRSPPLLPLPLLLPLGMCLRLHFQRWFLLVPFFGPRQASTREAADNYVKVAASLANRPGKGD